MSGSNGNQAEGKASFDEAYSAPDPRAFVRTLSELDYQIPEHARRVFSLLVAAVREQAGGDRSVVDLCCSYGINAALLNHELTLDQFYDHYADAEVTDWSAARLESADREFYADRRRPDAIRTVGLDTSAAAIDYAVSTGILDAGSSENLESDDPSERLAGNLSDTGLVTVTGGIGYITSTTFDRVLDAAQGRTPWVAAFCLRWVDMAPIAELLQGYGLVVERLDGRTFRQRRFADDAERAYVHAELDRLGIDTDGVEADGYHHADFYLARPEPAAASVPLTDLLAPIL